MKKNLLSSFSFATSLVRKSGKVAAVALAAVLTISESNAQTIFSNPVGIGVGAIAAGKDLHVNGPLRFNNLAAPGVPRMVTVDLNGDLSAAPIPGGALPPGTANGQSLLWNGAAWVPNNFLRVPAFPAGPNVFEVGNGSPANLTRTIHYGGSEGLALQGAFGLPATTWMAMGWRAVNNTNPLGSNFVGTRINWQNFAGDIGLSDRALGAQKDLNVQFQDFTVPSTSLATNRLIFTSVTGTPPLLNTREHATILGNGFMGIGTPNPLVRLQVNLGNIAQVSAGALAPPAPGIRWSAMGDRIPFAGGPGIISTGLRTQWDLAAINVGLTPDPTGTVPFSGLISWQDATAVGTGNNSLLFGARDNTNTNFFERMRIEWDGDVGIGTPSPLAKLHVQNGNIAQVSSGALAPPGPGIRWCAMGDRVPFGGPPGVVSTGLRAQWEQFAANYGVTKDALTGTIAGLISWQDANAFGTGNNPLIFGSRDASNVLFNERMRITWNGNVGINTQTPTAQTEIWSQPGINALRVSDAAGAVDYLTIDPTGHVGINTPFPIAPVGNFALGLGVPPFVPPIPAIRLSVNGTITTPLDIVAGGTVYAGSDARFKKDFTALTSNQNWKRVLNITPYSYKIDATQVDNFEVEDRLHYGFKAQDVAANIPELTKKWGDALVVNYQGFVPFLAAGLKEHEERLANVENTAQANVAPAVTALQIKNDELTARIKLLEDKLNGICNLPCVQEAIKQNTQEGTLNEQPQLFQNEPNPFGKTTVIKYFVPANANAAILTITDMNGKQMGSYDLKKGRGQLEISAGEISAGTYNYSLLVDNQLVDTKKMVIVNY